MWPGRPITAHWGIEDPAAVEGPGQREAFERALRFLQNRISLLVSLPMDSIDALTLRGKLREIGAGEGATATARGEPADG